MSMQKLEINPNFNLQSNFNLQLFSANVKPYLYPKNSRFELYTGNDEKYYFFLRATNGRIILRSTKGYSQKVQAVENIHNVIKFGIDKYAYDVESQNISGMGEYFILFDEDGQKLAISGNGKSYALAQPKEKYNIALKWQVVRNGVSKGINSCVANLQAIANDNKPILDYTFTL